MKNVLLLVHDDQGQEARLQVALDLTRALDGHLSCVDVAVVPPAGADYYGGLGTSILIAEARDLEAANKSAIAARLAHEDVAWDWSDVTGTLADAVVEAATLADLIVLNRKLDQEAIPDMRGIASSVLMRAHKPIVAVPDSVRHFSFGRALIAWDGQASAAATMCACVPLLALAEEVEIFMARDGGERAEPTEAAEYLSRHGIHASVRIIDDGLTAPDTLIGDECKRWGADYVLMGAYSHGRFMETFGGVTKRMLDHCSVPLVLGH